MGKLFKTFVFAAVGVSTWSCTANKPATTDNVIELEPAVIVRDEKPEWASKADQYPYRPSRTLLNDLIHTKLEVSFDYEKQYLNGTAYLTFTPYFYPQSQLVLDAKGFDIHEVVLVDKMNTTPLKYTYDDLQITIQLDKEYKKGEFYEVRIKYTAKPNELEEGGSSAITSDKGLYFIDPLDEDPEKPTQIWTQGETEASSCWFPTIDTPNEKTTQEIYITVEDKYVTLSNGRLVMSIDNGDSTRTDYWKQDKPHAPYLFMMAVGEFSIVTDKWKDKEVSYYVEPAYEPYARDIFGHTPEMIEFFSNKLDYEFPWVKYSQVVIRDFVSGAMENTSAATFLEQIQRTRREMLDKDYEYIIAHELFHHWFGDLVTCESWANLSVNESFANYSEYLWFEHKYGRDRADYHARTELEGYLQEAQTKQEPIVRFHYDEREDMFDAHSYNKGGRVMHMLRKYVGDDAFFASLNKYLKDNEYQPAEMHHLRLAFEEVTGEDMNWFFNQWFYSPGHPELKVNHIYNDSLKKLVVWVDQLQNLEYTPLYKIPVSIDYWVDGKKMSQDVVVNDTLNLFEIQIDKEPEAVLFDGEQAILGVIHHHKSEEEYINQYYLSDKYLAQRNALINLAIGGGQDGYNTNLDNPKVREVFVKALDNDFWELRAIALEVLLGYNAQNSLAEKVTKMAREDEKSSVRVKAIMYLTSIDTSGMYKEVYKQSLNDSSFAVIGAGLKSYAIFADSTDNAEKIIAKFEGVNNIDIAKTIVDYYSHHYILNKYDWLIERFTALDDISKIYFAGSAAQYILKLSAEEKAEALLYFKDITLNHDQKYARLAGYKVLAVMDSLEGSSQIREEARETEKNDRIKGYFQSIETSLGK